MQVIVLACLDNVESFVHMKIPDPSTLNPKQQTPRARHREAGRVCESGLGLSNVSVECFDFFFVVPFSLDVFTCTE